MIRTASDSVTSIPNPIALIVSLVISNIEAVRFLLFPSTERFGERYLSALIRGGCSLGPRLIFEGDHSPAHRRMKICRSQETGLFSLQPLLRVEVYDVICGDGISGLLLRDVVGHTADVVEFEHVAVAV